MERLRIRVRNVSSFVKRHFRLRFATKRLIPTGPFNYYILSDTPLIVLTFTPGGLAHVEAMAGVVPDRPVYFLVGFWWSMDKVERVQAFARQWKRIAREHRNARLFVLCNATNESTLFQERTSISTLLVNHNCFLDEFVYDVRDGRPKKYNAVLNARLAPYKRMELASQIQNLVIITAPMHGKIDESYRNLLRSENRYAKWPNFDADGSYNRLSMDAVVDIINESHVGLVLSAREGACYASAEYLLCGAPVVSTVSKGGRDEMFNPLTARVVPPDRQAIAEAVEYFTKNAPEPRHVRAETLSIIEKHRRRLFKLVDNIRAWEGETGRFEYEWETVFTNKMNYRGNLDSFQQHLSRDSFIADVVAERQRQLPLRREASESEQEV